MYRVMKPTYFKADGEFWGVRFEPLQGVLVSSMAEAKRTYGCAVVLQWCGDAQ